MTIDEAMQLGRQYHQAGRLAEAEALYRQVLATAPNYPPALHLIGVLAGQVGRLELAIDLIARSTQIDPNNALAWNDLSVFLKNCGRTDESIDACKRSIALEPGYGAAFSNLAAALIEHGDYHAGEVAARKAIDLSPSNGDAFFNLAGALRGMGKFAEAIEALRVSIRSRPDYGDAHANLGWVLLLTGNFSEGWTETLSTLQSFDSFEGATRLLTHQLWNGEQVPKGTILLYADKGLGDTLQFIRYLPMVAARVGRIIVLCQSELLRLLSDRPHADMVLRMHDPLPAFEARYPISSLPALFRTDLESMPPMTPLRPDDKILVAWKNRVGQRSDRLRV